MISRVLLRNNIRHQARLFSAASSANYESVSSEIWYTPERKVDFTNKAVTVFNADKATERRYVPFEYKELMITNGLGIFGVHLAGLVLDTNIGGSVGMGFFMFNYIYKTFNLANNSITKLELLESGTQVRLTFGKIQGKQLTVNIRDIKKQ